VVQGHQLNQRETIELSLPVLDDKGTVVSFSAIWTCR
jgi:hypothetical protein